MSTKFKPTKPKKSDLYKQDIERLERSLAKHEKEIDKPLSQYRDYYRGIQWAIDGTNKYNDKVVDNIVYGIVSSFVSSLYLGDIKVSVKPKTSQHVVNGKLADATAGAIRHQILSEFLYEELEVANTMEKVLVDSFLGHRAIVMTGWEVKTEDIEDDDEDDDDDEIDEDDDPKESAEKFNKIIESESLFVDRISPRDFITEVDARDPDLRDSKRVAVRWVKTPEEVKKDHGKDIRPNGELEKKNQDMIFSSFRRDGAQTPSKDVWARVEGYDIYDIENQEIRTVVIDEDDYVEKKKWPVDYKGKWPFDILWYNYMPDSAIPIADTSLYKSRQDNINIIHSKINDHVRKIADSKFAYNKNKVNKEDAEAFAKGPSGSTLPGKGDPNTFFSQFENRGVSQDMYINVANNKSDTMGMLGVSQFEAGGPRNFGSASEADKEQDGVAPKRAFRNDKYKKFVKNVIVKLSNIAAQVLPQTEIPLQENDFEDLAKNNPSILNGRRTNEKNEDGEDMIEIFPFTTIDKELLQGNFIFNVSIIASGPESEVKKRQDAELLYQKAAVDPSLSKTEVLKVWFDAFGFSHLKDRLLRDPKEVAQEQQAAMKAQIEAQIAIDAPKRDTDLQKTAMKTQASLAGTGMQLDQRENEGNRKFITANRDRDSSEKMSSIEKLLDLAKGNSNGGSKDA